MSSPNRRGESWWRTTRLLYSWLFCRSMPVLRCLTNQGRRRAREEIEEVSKTWPVQDWTRRAQAGVTSCCSYWLSRYSIVLFKQNGRGLGMLNVSLQLRLATSLWKGLRFCHSMNLDLDMDPARATRSETWDFVITPNVYCFFSWELSWCGPV